MVRSQIVRSRIRSIGVINECSTVWLWAKMCSFKLGTRELVLEHLLQGHIPTVQHPYQAVSAEKAVFSQTGNFLVTIRADLIK